MLEVQVTQQNAKARLDVQDPFLRLKTTDVEVQISSQPLKMEISSPAADLQIDSYPSNRARGNKNNIDFDRENAQKGMQALQNFIAKIAREGTAMARIESHGQPLRQFAKEAMAAKSSDLTLAYVPDPSIRVTPHEAKVRFDPGPLNISFKQGTTSGNLQRGTVDINMIQYPQVNFHFVDKKI